MQSIHVKRYDQPASYAGTVEPEDRSWIVFVGNDGEATLWRRVETRSDDGQIIHGYENVEA